MSSVLGRARVAPPPPRAFVICYCPHHPSRPPGRSHASPAPARGTVKPDRSCEMDFGGGATLSAVGETQTSSRRRRSESGVHLILTRSGELGGGTSLLWQNEFTGGKNCRRIAGELQEGKRGDSTRACGWKNINVLGSWLQCFARLVHFLLACWVECNHPM